jgi:hypothetical protein
MLKSFKVEYLLYLGSLVGTTGLDDSSDVMEQGARDELASMLRLSLEDLAPIGLPCSVKAIERMIESLQRPECTYADIKEQALDLERRLHDEFDSMVFMYVPTGAVRFWQAPQLFGEKVLQTFPSAQRDIEEAGNCLACGRGTAAVFHLMRVMEVGLRAIALKLAIPYKPSWESYLEHIERKLAQDRQNKDAEWIATERFFREALSYLRAVKVAWRNPVMHIESHYAPEQAEEILNAVGVFMRHLATSPSSS